MSQKTPTYGNELDKPIKPTPALAAKDCKKYHELISRRWGLLMKHYGLDPKKPKDWSVVGLCIATEWIPGFQIDLSLRQGAPKKKITTEAVLARNWLLKQADELKQKNYRLGAEPICKRLARKSDLPKVLRDRNGNALATKTLVEWLREARKEKNSIKSYELIISLLLQNVLKK